MNLRIKLLVFLFSPIFLFGQSESLKEVEITEISPSKIDPTPFTEIESDSSEVFYQGNDPYFTISKLIPNTFSQSDNGLPYGYSYLRVRGMDQTRINFTLNGIPLNEMEDQGIYFSNMPDFLSNVSSIQVTRGIGSSKYGITSIAGSVNMETELIPSKGTTAELGFGSYATNRYSAGISTGLHNKFFFSSKAGALLTEGFREHSSSIGFNYFGEGGYFHKKNFVKIYGFVGGSRNQMAWMPVYREMLSQNYRLNLNSESEKDKFNQNFVSLNWVNFSKKDLRFNSSIYLNNIDGFYTSYLDTSSLGRFGLRSNQYGAMSNALYQWKSFNFNLGVNYNYYERKHTLSLNESPSDLFYKNYGFKNDIITYLKSYYHLRDYYLFTDIQFRSVVFNYDKLVKYNWNFLNPKIGIRRVVSNKESWVSFGRTSREVTRTDLFNGYDNINISNGVFLSDDFGSGSDTILVNTLPEIVYDFEMGMRWTKNRYDISTNFYCMSIDNERIISGEVNYIGLPLKEPTKRSVRTGIELDSKYYIRRWEIGLIGSYSYNEILETGNSPGFSPNFLMNNILFYKISKRIKIGGIGSYVSGMYLDNSQNSNLKTSSYYLMGLNSEINLSGFYISFISNNILNQKYYLPGGVYQNRGQFYSGSLRSYFVSFKFKLNRD